MKKYIIIGIPCLIAIIVASFYSLGNKSAIQYKTAIIDTGPISKYVTATGTINPVRTVLIGSQVTGLISKLYVDFNSTVKVGQVVAQIDPVPFEHPVKKAEAALATAIASLEKAKVNSKNNRKNYLRSKKLFAKKVISINDLDAARTTYDQCVPLRRYCHFQRRRRGTNGRVQLPNPHPVSYCRGSGSYAGKYQRR